MNIRNFAGEIEAMRTFIKFLSLIQNSTSLNSCFFVPILMQCSNA